MGRILDRHARFVLETGGFGGAGGATGATGAAGATGPTGPSPPGTGILIDNAGAPSALAVTAGQTALGGPTPIARGVQAVNNILSFGAKGDGVTNDRVAIVAAIAAAVANGLPVYVPNVQSDLTTPAVAFLTDQEIAVPRGVAIFGDAAAFGQSTIRASASMRSVLAPQTTTTAVTPPFPAPVTISRLTVDANLNATYGIFRNSDWQARYTEVFVANAPLDGWHAPTVIAPVVVGAVVQTGGGPAITSITQPDPNFTSFFASPTSVVVKVIVGGAFQAATLAISIDGGATFSTATQVGDAQINLNLMAAALYGSATGLQINFNPAGLPFVVNTTYAFTVTRGTGQVGNSGAICAEARFENCWAKNCGTLTATVGLVGFYNNGLLGQFVAAPAVTATRVGFSQIVSFSGPAPFIMTLRPGDFFIAAGLPPMLVAGALDPQHLALDANDAAANGTSVAGVDWATGRGALYWEDRATTVGDFVRNVIRGGEWEGAPVLISGSGRSDGGLHVEDAKFDNQYAFKGIAIGGINPVGQILLARNDHNGSIVTTGNPIYIGGGCSGTLLEPAQTVFPITGPGTLKVVYNGLDLPYGGGVQSWMPISTLQLLLTSNIFGSAAATITPPTFNVVGSSSMHFIDLVASFVMTATPLIAAPPFFDPSNVPLMTLVNNTAGAHSFTLQDDFVSASGLFLEAPEVTIGPQEAITFLALTSGKWKQLHPVGKSYTGPNGSSGEGDRSIQTTTNAVTEIYYTDSGFLPGTQIEVDISANSPGAGIAHWKRLVVFTNDAGANIGDNFPGGTLVASFPPIVVPAAPPFGWTVSVTVSGSRVHINVIGDNAHTVAWKCHVRLLVAASSAA